MIEHNFIRSVNLKFFLIFIISWLCFLIFSPYQLSELLNYASFSILGVVGAIFANATGAGGGVIFIPMFNQLSFTENQAIATSFAIQCFGMSAGAITWWHYYKIQKTELRLWEGFKRTVVLTSVASMIGLGTIFYLELRSPTSLHTSFSIFSLLLGGFIIATAYLIKPSKAVNKIHCIDYIVFIVIGLFGGAITAWLSIGVGELLAIYLILRRFDISMAVASAVMVSAITVWSAIGQVNKEVYWQVVMFAGPGAVLGGIFAKTLVMKLSAVKLKVFFASWLLITGTVSLL